MPQIIRAEKIYTGRMAPNFGKDAEKSEAG